MMSEQEPGAVKSAPSPHNIGEHPVAVIGKYHLFYVRNDIKAIHSNFISKIGSNLVVNMLGFEHHLIDLDMDLVNWVGKTTTRIHFEHPLKDRTLCGMKYSRAFRMVEGDAGGNSLECRRCEKMAERIIKEKSKSIWYDPSPIQIGIIPDVNQLVNYNDFVILEELTNLPDGAQIEREYSQGNCCPMCGSKEHPKAELEIMPDGSTGAGVIWTCPDCGHGEM